jgi:nucleoside-diphosphate-sugar epimerase
MPPTFRAIRLTPQVLLRIAADTVLINVAVLTALVLRFLYLITFERSVPSAAYDSVFTNLVASYLTSAVPLTLICLMAFYISGFYTHGRAYRGRYKAVIIFQAVTLAYLLFGFLSYFVGGGLVLPRAVLILGWILSLLLLGGARLWSRLWTTLTRAEQRLQKRPTERKIQNVLVIGGAGYIGSALLPKLLAKGYNVRLLDLLLYGTEPIEEFLHHPRMEIVQADFRQVDKVVEAIRDMDAVIHLGAIVGDPACALDEDLTIEVNLMATRMIAEVAKGHGVNRFIFASTCSVYGASNEMLDERSVLNPVSLYARSKIASERVLAKKADDNFAPVILRFGTIYGLSGRTRFDLVVNLLTAKAVLDGEITVFGGNQWRPFVHVDDAALAVLKALEAPLPLVRNEIFNVGSGEQNYTIQQAGEIIHSLVPQAKLISMGNDTDQRNYRVNFNKIHNALGFVPQWTVEKGVQQVIEAIRSGKVTDYRHARYSNVKFLSEEGASRLLRSEPRWAYDLINEDTSEFELVAIHSSNGAAK